MWDGAKSGTMNTSIIQAPRDVMDDGHCAAFETRVQLFQRPLIRISCQAEVMIPTKRSSPFVRARTFHVNRTRKGLDGEEEEEAGTTGGSPFKRPSLARTLSNPFQVLTPSLKNVRNPFERLTLTPTTAFDPNVQDTREESLEVPIELRV